MNMILFALILIFACIPKWYVGIAIGMGFLTYYLRSAKRFQRPALVCSRGKFREFLERHVPVLEEKFFPTPWCLEPRAQTILASFIRSRLVPNVPYRREVVPMSDGGQIGLDWLEDGCRPDAPVVIILPGLTGSSEEEYVKCLALAANRIGLRVVVFNYRGLGGVPVTTARLYCGCNFEDLSEVIEHVQKLNPGVQLGATGISMGSLVLGNYLASEGKAARKVFSAAMFISSPWNVAKGVESIEKPGINILLNRYLTSSLQSILVRAKEQMAKGPLDFKEALLVKTLRDFDSKWTSLSFGYKDAEDYYCHSSLHDKIDRIAVPLLCLNAADDPFQPFEVIPIEAAEKSENVAILVTEYGGHLGFMEGVFPAVEGQYMSRVFSQFFTAVFEQDTDFHKVFASIN